MVRLHQEAHAAGTVSLGGRTANDVGAQASDPAMAEFFKVSFCAMSKTSIKIVWLSYSAVLTWLCS